MAIPDTLHNLLPAVGAGERREDRLIGALLAAQLIEFGSQVFLGLAHRGFVDTIDVSLSLASRTRQLTIALKKELQLVR